MIDALLDFLRTLTDPERLIRLLTTALTGWLGYALLCGVIFAETGLLMVFFCPAIRCSSRWVWWQAPAS